LFCSYSFFFLILFLPVYSFNPSIHQTQKNQTSSFSTPLPPYGTPTTLSKSGNIVALRWSNLQSPSSLDFVAIHSLPTKTTLATSSSPNPPHDNPTPVTPRIPNNVNHTCKSEYYNVYGMIHFVKYLNNRVKFSINKVNINW